MSDPSEKIVLVTGGSGGLGRSLARAFARQGCRVVIAGRSAGKLQAAAEEIGKQDFPVLALSCDIRQKDQVDLLAQEVRTRLGSVQILVNNAGIAQAMSFFGDAGELVGRDSENQLDGALIIAARHFCRE